MPANPCLRAFCIAATSALAPARRSGQQGLKTAILMTLFAATTLAVSVAQAAPKQADVTVLHVGWLLAVPGQAPTRENTITIRDGRIARVDRGYIQPAIAPTDHVRTIELRDAFVLPGLMDVHVHLSSPSEPNKPFRLTGVSNELEATTAAQRNDVTQMVDAVANARKTLMAGYTTVRDLGSSGWHIAALRDGIAAGVFEGPRIFAAMNIIHPGSDEDAGACTGVESCRRAVRRQIDMGADVIKVYTSCSGSKPCGRQDAPPVFLPDELEAIVQTARSRQLRVAAHAHSEAAIREAAQAGVNSIEHGSYTPADVVPLLKSRGIFLVPTLSVQDNIRRDIRTATGAMHEVMANFLARHGPRMMAAYHAGVRIVDGSDAGITGHGDNARELELYVREGMPAADAIKAATVNAAALLQRETDLGTIEPGKIADIIAVPRDPLADISALRAVSFVMKDGTVYRDDRPVTGTP